MNIELLRMTEPDPLEVQCSLYLSMMTRDEVRKSFDLPPWNSKASRFFKLWGKK
jgi:hypothetical protein